MLLAHLTAERRAKAGSQLPGSGTTINAELAEHAEPRPHSAGSAGSALYVVGTTYTKTICSTVRKTAGLCLRLQRGLQAAGAEPRAVASTNLIETSWTRHSRDPAP